MLIVTKLDRKGATSRYQALKHKLNSIREHGKWYFRPVLYSNLVYVSYAWNDFQRVRKLRVRVARHVISTLICYLKFTLYLEITILCWWLIRLCRYLLLKFSSETLHGFINPVVLICIPFYRIPSSSSTRNHFKQPNNPGKCQLDRINWGTYKDEFWFCCTIFRTDIIWFRRPSS